MKTLYHLKTKSLLRYYQNKTKVHFIFQEIKRLKKQKKDYEYLIKTNDYFQNILQDIYYEMDYKIENQKTRIHNQIIEKKSIILQTNDKKFYIKGNKKKDIAWEIKNYKNHRLTLKEKEKTKYYRNIKLTLFRILKKFQLSLGLKPKSWLDNKGLIVPKNPIIILNPYSKTAPYYKNKQKNHYINTEIKNIFLEAFALTDNKYSIWLNQSQKISLKQNYVGNIYKKKKKYGFIIGLNGLPVLLHRKELKISSKNFEKVEYIYNLKQNKKIICKVLEKAPKEKRINIYLYKKTQNININNKN